jgi:cation diffusion facilitator CzcD-associated flavoprotein CzcO
MAVEHVNTLVVGAGQSGIAASEHLSAEGVSHLVVERSRIAERWRSERWDSLVQNGPVWHDRFPNMEFAGFEPGEFAGKEAVADYFVEYARKIGAPVRCGVEVRSVTRKPAGGFVVETSDGTIEADNLIAATGPFQKPLIPTVVPDTKLASRSFIHRSTAIRISCRKARFWWLAQGLPVPRLPMNSPGPGARSTCRSGRMTGRRGGIGARTLSGGLACWASGT